GACIGRHAGDDSPRSEPSDDVFRFTSFDVEADETPRERPADGGPQRDATHVGHPRPKPGTEHPNPRFDATASDRLVEPEGLRKRPAMLERVEAARREPRTVRG